MELLDGKKLSSDLKDEIQAEVRHLTAAGHRKPHLVAILVGNNPASMTYVASKVKACNRVGFASTEMLYPDDITEAFLLRKIGSLNADPDVDGILVQLPLPAHISENKVLEAIAPERDVDGFHPVNIGRMVKGLPSTWPATPAGVLEMLIRYKIETVGKVAVIIGKSNIVGTPMRILLSGDHPGGNATTISCDIYTSKAGNLAHFTRQADILVVATGVPNLIRGDMVKEGATVVDVGINRIEDKSNTKGYKIVGDVAFDEVAPKCSYITPVPGGVGPMTIAMLLQNTLKLYKKQLGIDS
ncbi:MAG: bifunctional 5,10-methylenetetrahydrofolate dehydrogenase/5,10-methenyltetrahydrofolate cyclohydrolase [Bacteroidia bacterium]|nr:bifunctional 5,10-methylenetetrahydrofolate dehydrogenase/5,10-methenyltetrahydrofolate cyclohydrolase [Bacteroidia bacterium]